MGGRLIGLAKCSLCIGGKGIGFPYAGFQCSILALEGRVAGRETSWEFSGEFFSWLCFYNKGRRLRFACLGGARTGLARCNLCIGGKDIGFPCAGFRCSIPGLEDCASGDEMGIL